MDNKRVNTHVKIRRREVLRRKLHLGRGEGNAWVGVPLPVRCPKKETLRCHLGRPGIGGAERVGGKGGSRETSQGAVARLWGSRLMTAWTRREQRRWWESGGIRAPFESLADPVAVGNCGTTWESPSSVPRAQQVLC